MKGNVRGYAKSPGTGDATRNRFRPRPGATSTIRTDQYHILKLPNVILVADLRDLEWSFYRSVTKSGCRSRGQACHIDHFPGISRMINMTGLTLFFIPHDPVLHTSNRRISGLIPLCRLAHCPILEGLTSMTQPRVCRAKSARAPRYLVGLHRYFDSNSFGLWKYIVRIVSGLPEVIFCATMSIPSWGLK